MPIFDQLTSRQKEVYEFIRDKIRSRGYGPTVREIGSEFAISSPNGVMCHLKALEKKGLIIRSPNKSRAIELAQEAIDEERTLPWVGTVAAGLTTLAIEQPAERIDFAEMFNRKSYFVLSVRGDSMIEAQIADGDYVIVKRQRTAAPGQMVVAQTSDGEATLKYWHPEANRVRLQPANASMAPIYLTDVSVLGVVVGVVRRI
ncbi:MAG: transcriptional repressor LexA [Planctomycetes bacterium]|nr:transcriptional repressor LexA [Planctomycetota bacterium]